ncbi:MAG: GNAT family N-acetyltransferase [Anaerolineae bacterium]|nr:GNAT family N-acetyltransferase [Anaerolineae bacterium]
MRDSETIPAQAEVGREIPNILVNMARATLDDLPRYPLPDGYALRMYQPGDAQAWVDIHLEADRWNHVTLETFWKEFGVDPIPLAARQFYLCTAEGTPIGTATGWFNADYYGAAWGRIHWVALRPAYHGRGLAKPLLAAACWRMRELGHDKAYLVTSTPRIPAINLYRSFGFEPEIRSPEDGAAWSLVRPYFKR